jgi:ArsR family transcriptional regulator
MTPPLIRRRADLFRMLGDPTRLQILAILARGTLNVGALCGHLDVPQPAVSGHLALLRHAGLVQCQRRGKENHYSLAEDRAEEIRPLVGGLEVKASKSQAVRNGHARRAMVTA